METKNLTNLETIVPQCTVQDFLSTVVNTLGSYQWPEGSIQCIDPAVTRLVYLYGNRIRGKAEGTWSAKINGTSKLTVNGKERDIVDGTPYSGSLPQLDFELAVINDNKDTPYWAKEFCKSGCNCENLQPASGIAMGNAIIEGSNTGNSLSSWLKNGNAIVDEALLPDATTLSRNAAIVYLALDLIPAEVIQQSGSMFSSMKIDSRDVTVSTRNSVEDEPVPVLIPFYVLEFKFEGKQYHIAMSADGSKILKGQIPPVKESSETPEDIINREMPEKVKQVKMMKWGWLVAVILFFIINLTVAFIVLVAWAIGLWVMKKPINDRIKGLKQQDSINSQKIAQQLKKQLLG